MAKISTYPTTTPALSDILIGTDVSDTNSTKNFTVGSLLDVAGSTTYVPYTGGINDVYLPGYGFYANEFVVYGGTSFQFLKADGSVDNNVYLTTAAAVAAYVPYSGATGNVTLGANNITAQSFIKSGGLSSQFLKADGSVDSSAYITAAALTGLVPYTGASGNVTLGAWNLAANLITTGTIEAPVADFIAVMSNGELVEGILVDFINNRYSLGDRNGIVNGTHILVNDATQRIMLYAGDYIGLNAALSITGGVGSDGDILVSQGVGLPPRWESGWTEVTVTVGPTGVTYSDGRPAAISGINAMGSVPIELLPAPAVGEYLQYEIDLKVPGASTITPGTADSIYIGSPDYDGNLIRFSDYNSVADVVFQIGSRNSVNESIANQIYAFPMQDARSVIMTSWNGNDPTTSSGTCVLVVRYKTKTF